MPPELAEAERVAAYDCVSPYMAEAYARSSHEAAAAYRNWTRFSRITYPTEGHGLRFMNNYANDVARDAYGQFEGVSTMPTGSVLVKDSFIVTPDGAILVGPLFVMEKRTTSFSEAARGWFYQMIMPDGAVRVDAEIQSFCNDCHRRAGAVDDHLMFLPLPYRIPRTDRNVAAIPLVSPIVDATEYTVFQKGKQFSVKTLSTQVGDTVVFGNDDEFAHNIYSETPGFEFDFRKQMPGEKDTLMIENEGVFEVRCAIHPRMKLTIYVE